MTSAATNASSRASSRLIARIAALYRYPVKGLSPEPLTCAELKVDREIAHDRSWAIEDAPGKFDPAAPRHLPKINYLMLMRHAALATLDTQFDPETSLLTLSRDGHPVASGELQTETGRVEIETCLAELLAGQMRGRPKIVTADGHTFSDVAMKCLHLINRNSIAALEEASGTRIDPRRFRANVVLENAPAWAEFDWIGQTIHLGGAEVEVVTRTVRCAATEVDPATGARDLDMLDLLRRTVGHTDFGVYARVRKAGAANVGDDVRQA